MQIQITIRWSRRRAPRGFFTLRSVMNHIRCHLGGHDEEVVVGNRSLAVRCRLCGWTSTGVRLDHQQPRQLFR